MPLRERVHIAKALAALLHQAGRKRAGLRISNTAAEADALRDFHRADALNGDDGKRCVEVRLAAHGKYQLVLALHRRLVIAAHQVDFIVEAHLGNFKRCCALSAAQADVFLSHQAFAAGVVANAACSHQLIRNIFGKQITLHALRGHTVNFLVIGQVNAHGTFGNHVYDGRIFITRRRFNNQRAVFRAHRVCHI